MTTLRRGIKPLHPRGSVTTGVLVRHGTEPKSGVPWLDEAGQDEVIVRRSRAVGLPPRAPDIHGLALRVPTPDGGYGDLLFASTGLGRLTRFTLTASRISSGRPMTTLLPYRSPSGAIVLSATQRDEGTFELSWARASGPWHPFAALRLWAASSTSDALITFDPVLNTVPGLENFGWVQRMRRPAYAQAQQSRSKPDR